MTDDLETIRLDELDKEEWLQVARRVCPGITDEAYNRMWDDFAADKAERELQAGLH